MEDYSGKKPKKDGIKAHKAAQERKGDWRSRTPVNRERKPQREHSVQLREDFGERRTARESRDIGGERPDRETRRRQETARLKRRKRRQIQRLLVIGGVILALILAIVLVKIAAKGISIINVL